MIANTPIQPTVIEDVNPNDFAVPKGMTAEQRAFGNIFQRAAQYSRAALRLHDAPEIQ